MAMFWRRYLARSAGSASQCVEFCGPPRPRVAKYNVEL